MKQYQDLVRKVLEEGVEKKDRTGTGTLSIFGPQVEFDLRDGAALVTTKKLHFKSIAIETLWFISGSTNNNDLKKHGVSIWDEWAEPDGNLNRIYGKNWRAWENSEGEEVDQLASVIEDLKNNPDSRRHIVLAYNPGDVLSKNPKLKPVLPACHSMFQLYSEPTTEEGVNYLSLKLYLRSSDLFLGFPYNSGGYDLMCRMIAQCASTEKIKFIPKKLIMTMGDAHLYLNHLSQARELISRDPLPPAKIILNPDIKKIDDFKFEDIQLVDYKSHPAIKAPVSI